MNNSEAKHAATIIKSVVRAREVYVDESLNALVVRDTPEIVQLAEKLVTMQDQAEAEVELEVEVLEVSKKNLRDLGIHPPTEIAITSLGADNASIQTVADLKNLDSTRLQVAPLSAVIKMRMEQGDAKILANPRIRVKNREHAKIQIGERIPVITSTITSGNTGGFLPETVNYLDVGIKFEVEPLIFRNNDVRIKVDLEVSSLGQKTVTKLGSEVYRVGTRNAGTTLRLQNGETQMLAGLINDEERNGTAGIPFLGEIPILGYLFSSKDKSKEKTEIVLLITPRVIRNITLPDADFLEYGAGTEAMLGDRQAGSPSSSGADAPRSLSSGASKPNANVPGQSAFPSFRGGGF
jgi:general secretion pathway protein D